MSAMKDLIGDRFYDPAEWEDWTMESVLTIPNRGEQHYVADDYDDLGEKIAASDGQLEILCDQCDSCGSFAPSITGEVEPGPGFFVSLTRDPGRVEMKTFQAWCGCCFNVVPISWTESERTVF